MSKELHHGVPRTEHCAKVALKATKLYRKNDEQLIAGALLHDFFLNEQDSSLKGHSKTALYNIDRESILITPEIEHIILSHMWPIAGCIPRTRRAWCVNIADKIVSLKEWVIK